MELLSIDDAVARLNLNKSSVYTYLATGVLERGQFRGTVTKRSVEALRKKRLARAPALVREVA